MKYLNTGLVCEQSGLSCVELPKICIPVYREVVKEMAEVIKDSQMRDVFYSLSTGIDVQTVSKKTGVAPRNLALLTHSQECGGQNFKNVVIVVREQDIPSECVDLLITPLGNLDINFRVLRALRKYNIYQLEDLLRFIKYNGFDALCRIPGIGMKSVEQLRKILEDKETCMLFRYLFV